MFSGSGVASTSSPQIIHEQVEQVPFKMSFAAWLMFDATNSDNPGMTQVDHY